MSETSEKDNTLSLARVAFVFEEDFAVTINKGSNEGVEKGHRYLLYSLSSEEIADPETGESLGHLELVKGTGVVIHVQDKMSTIESDRTEKTSRRIVRKPSSSMGILGIGLMQEEEHENLPAHKLPFDSPAVGDYAKRIPKAK